MYQGLNLIYVHVWHQHPYGFLRNQMSYCALTFMLHGEMEYSVNGKTKILKAGNAAYAKPGDLRLRQMDQNTPSYISLNFRCDPDSTPELPSYFDVSVTKEFLALAERMQQYFYSDNRNRMEITQSMLSVILYECEESCKNTLMLPYAAKIKQYIAEHYTSRFSIEDLAESIGISPSYASALFKKSTGESIGTYLNSIRCNAASDMIVNTSMQFQEIADCLGFTSNFYFSRWFMKQTGMTPRDFRTMEKKKRT